MIHPYDSIRKMVSQNCFIDGIVCYNDQIAMKVIQALYDEGIKVPEQISVTGYDNSYMANSNGLRLTTILHPQEKLGEMAAEVLINKIKDQNFIQRENLISTELIPRLSTRKV